MSSHTARIQAEDRFDSSTKAARGGSVLYISYDGVLEPLGRSQVLEYLIPLSHRHRIVLITFEKGDDWRQEGVRRRVQQRIGASGIHWVPLRYHKTPTLLATTYDICCGFLVAAPLARRHRIQIVHARSYVSAVIALALQKMFGVKFVFDMRGFWADEKVEGGSWRRNALAYRIAKWFERRFLINADVVISLTHAGVKVLSELPYLAEKAQRYEVITTCTNPDLFRPGSRVDSHQPERPLVIGMVGSVGLWYMPDEMIAAFVEFRRIRPNATLLILNRDAHEGLRRRLGAAGLAESTYVLKSVDYDDVPAEMRKMDVGIFLIRPSFSKLASAPTKFGEFLASGVPCLVNEGVGDVGDIVRAERVGIALDGFDTLSIRAGVRQMIELLDDPELRNRCTEAARRHFALEDGIESYERIYSSLVPVGLHQK
jgi:glycosyltransferase involved in cell wall biosynthesis